jgi:transcriptional regulator GlxA family with amidase domain
MAEQKTLATVLFNGFELLDVFGPLEAFGMYGLFGGPKLITVAERAGAVKSAQGVAAIADHSFDDCPHADLILVPGGMGTRDEANNQRFLNWLATRAADAECVMSVCTGAGLLARAGLLDRRRATTNKAFFNWVAEQGPQVKWVKEARWVEDGKFVTAAGVSAGIDMALAVIAKMSSEETAAQAAYYMEYEWHRDAAWDPFAKRAGLV